jgi:hypothetical protein
MLHLEETTGTGFQGSLHQYPETCPSGLKGIALTGSLGTPFVTSRIYHYWLIDGIYSVILYTRYFSCKKYASSMQCEGAVSKSQCFEITMNIEYTL